ncbi:MAG: hypothetical protein IJ624_00635 [Prevotella sp.]|nr:hypothetical protein [Prevotella sp.]
MDYELEEMRRQMQTLKDKLEKQEIVNEHIIKKSMKKNVDSIARRYYVLIAVALLMLPYGYWAFVMLNGFSHAFWIATCVMMLICAAATYYNSRNVSNVDMTRNNLVEVGKRMARAKKFDADWLFLGIPMIIAWLGWFVYEVYKQDSDVVSSPLLWAGCVGGVVGAIVGFSIHFKTQRQYQEIIDQIEDITGE